jgi:biotin synthase-like enzyme
MKVRRLAAGGRHAFFAGGEAVANPWPIRTPGIWARSDPRRALARGGMKGGRDWLLSAWRPLARIMSRPFDSGYSSPPAEAAFGTPRNDWRKAEIKRLFGMSFADLILQAHLMHRTHHDPRDTEIGTLQRLIEHRSSRSFNSDFPSGAILEMRTGREERVTSLHRLATHSCHAKEISVTADSAHETSLSPRPKLMLVREFNGLELARTSAVARIVMPTTRIRIAAASERMSEALHTLCFLAGANLIFFSANRAQNNRCEAPAIFRTIWPARSRYRPR